jgi:histidinol dehydrogenase
MLSIYDVETAKKTILKRTPLNNVTYPSATLVRTEQLFGKGITPPQAVTLILASVRLEGDAALRRWCQLLERTLPETFRVPPEKLEQAYRSLSPDLLEALQTAARRIRRFHEFQPLPNWETSEMGGRLGQRVTPIERVGVYVPGGTAPLPSSLLMSVIPAQVAGVRQIVVCTPPEPQPVILAAAYLCGVDQVYRLGGAQAIAALTFGTESVPKVDKIVGAGNLFVTLAKQQVYGTVGLDGLAGPTETVVVADKSAKPSWVAADLLAQAEHDVLASAILLTPERGLAESVQAEVARQMENLSRSEIIAQSLAERSGIVLTPDLETACALASGYAAEHTCLAVADPEKWAPSILNAGGLFLGEHSFEVLGDYVAGPSHVMPTGGTARFASPLNVMDFVKISSIIALDEASGRELSKLAATIARAEGLTAHATAADFRALSPLPAPFGGASRREGQG